MQVTTPIRTISAIGCYAFLSWIVRILTAQVPQVCTKHTQVAFVVSHSRWCSQGQETKNITYLKTGQYSAFFPAFSPLLITR